MMPIIIDANCASEALCANPTADFVPILAAIKGGKAKLVYGGSKLLLEYQRQGRAWRFLLLLDRAGMAKLIDHARVDAEQIQIENEFALTSDDPHVIALARISGARLLCSRDQALHADFLDPTLISNPRGRVYQVAAHAPLIRQCCNAD